MNAKEWTDLAIAAATIGVLIVGVVLIVAIALILWRAQIVSRNKNPFDAAQMFQDENNRTSGSRFLGLIGGVASVWIVLYLTVSGKLDATLFVGWLAVIVLGKVGSEVAAKIGEK